MTSCPHEILCRAVFARAPVLLFHGIGCVVAGRGPNPSLATFLSDEKRRVKDVVYISVRTKQRRPAPMFQREVPRHSSVQKELLRNNSRSICASFRHCRPVLCRADVRGGEVFRSDFFRGSSLINFFSSWDNTYIDIPDGNTTHLDRGLYWRLGGRLKKDVVVEVVGRGNW